MKILKFCGGYIQVKAFLVIMPLFCGLNQISLLFMKSWSQDLRFDVPHDWVASTLEKAWISVFVYQLTKNLFYDEMIFIWRTIFPPNYIKIGDKKFLGSKNTKGVSLQIFLGLPKKKNLFNKSCRYLKTDGIKWLYFFDILKVKIKKVYTIPFNMW